MRPLLILLISFFLSVNCIAQEDSLPKQRTLNSYFPFEVPESPEAWESRKQLLRDHLKTSLGLNPLPEKTPLNAVIFDSIDKGDYVIKKVYFESMPGFLVTGNLYKPKNLTEKAPAVLSPHGHHRDGRFRSATDADIDGQIAKGAEKFRNNARSPLQARCAHLAKMGCVVFHYDMIGYADSQQISYDLAHRFAQRRDHMNQEENYGFFSPVAESRSQSIMGLQTWNSIRALDFLESLKEVDTDRIGVTGASGGGTQTFILCALDDRPAVSFPAVMVSTAMQGGCTCENCSHLRVGTGNVEFAAMFAPKPMGLTAADDWTKEMETKGFPELKKLYAMLGKPDNVQLTARLEFEHNYNQVCREAMYRFFDKHLGLNGLTEESEIEFVSPDDLKVINDANRPKLSGEALESDLLPRWQSLRSEAINNLKLNDLEIAGFYRERIGDLLGNRISPLKITLSSVRSAEGNTIVTFVDTDGYQFDARIQSTNPDQPSVLLIGNDEVLSKKLAGQGLNVVSVTFNNDQEVNKLVNNGRAAAGYTFGYNRTQLARRASQLVKLVQLSSQSDQVKPIIVGTGDGVELAVLVASQVTDDAEGLAISNWDELEFSTESLTSKNFLPGSQAFGKDAYRIAVGDLPALLGGTAPSNNRQFAEPRPANRPAPEYINPDDFETRLLEWCVKSKQK